MTPVVYVKTTEEDNKENSFEPMLVLVGVAFLFGLVYAGFVLYRRFYLGIGWCDSFSSTQRNTRLDKANRAHRNNTADSEPKKPTIVRFKIDGVVLGDEA